MHSERPLDTDFSGRPTSAVDVHPAGDAEAVRLVVLGDLDSVNGPLLRNAVLDVLRSHRPGRIEMDFRGVGFLDSAGIRALVLSQADAEDAGSRITLSGTTPIVHRVLEITDC